MIGVLAQVGAFFTLPWLAAAGAAAVSIPIAIHLLSRFRRRTQPWAAMRFIQEAFRRQRRRLQFEQWLLLALRCLIVLVLGLALAGPVLTGCAEQMRALGLWSGGGRTVYLVLDDSLTSRAVDPVTGKPRFDALRATAMKLIDGLGPGDHVRVWRASRPVGEVGGQNAGNAGNSENTGNKEGSERSAEQLVQNMRPRYSRADLRGAMEQVSQAIQTQREGGVDSDAAVVVISAFSRSQIPVPGEAVADNPSAKASSPALEDVELYVSRPMADAPNGQVQLIEPRGRVIFAGRGGSPTTALVPVTVTLRRYAQDAAGTGNLTVSLLDHQGRGIGQTTQPIAWSPGEENRTLHFDLPIQTDTWGDDTLGKNIIVRASLDPAAGDALSEDDQRLAAVEIRQHLRVGILASQGLAGAAQPPETRAFTPLHWLALALAPTAEGPMRIRTISPDALNTWAAAGKSDLEHDPLAALDAAVVLRPDLLSAQAWRRLASFAHAGSVVWVFTPSAGASATWTAAMRSAFDLNWRIALEATPVGTSDGAGLVGNRQPPDALSLLSADWDALLRPVRVRRWLPVYADAQAAWLALNLQPKPARSEFSNEAPNGAGAKGHPDLRGSPTLPSQDRLTQTPALLTFKQVGSGALLFESAALDATWTNLPAKPLFVPLLHETLRGLLGRVTSQPLDSAGAHITTHGVVAGDQPRLTPPWPDGSIVLHRLPIAPLAHAASQRSEGAGKTLLFKDRLATSSVNLPGVYALTDEDGGDAAMLLPVNVDAAGGDTRAASTAADGRLADWLDSLNPLGRWSFLNADDPAGALRHATASPHLGWALLWLLLGLVVLETVLARVLSHAHAATATSSGLASAAVSRLKRFTLGRPGARGHKAAALAWPMVLAQLHQPRQAASLHPGGAPSWLDQLFGLHQVSWSDAHATLGWQHALPAWGWALIILGAAAFAAWSYSRLLGPRPVRAGLAVLRGTILLALAVLLAGPTLINPRQTRQPDTLIMLVDRSESMQWPDMTDPKTHKPVSRNVALKHALLTQANVFGDDALAARSRHMMWMGFGRRVWEMPPLTNAAAWDRPDVKAHEPGTALRTALEHALRATAGQPLAGIVLFSDGQSPQNTSTDLILALKQRGVAVDVVPLGAAKPPLDLRLAQVQAPARAFLNDDAPVNIVVDRAGGVDGQGGGGGGGAVNPADVTVELLEADTGKVVARRTLAGAGFSQPVRLTVHSKRVGKVKYIAKVVFQLPSQGEGSQTFQKELITSNNQQSFVIDMIDRPIRVLYIDGYPRWAYRYLKNMLVREKSIDCSILLLSADHHFAQEGDTPITRAPATAKELEPYDVIILGDIPPNYFTANQLILIRDHVSVDGAGLIWLGGARYMPAAWANTALADLLPMQSPSSVARDDAATDVRVVPTPLARMLNVLTLRGPQASGIVPEPGVSQNGTWPDTLPPLRWVQSVGPLKPAAEVLARGRDQGIKGPRDQGADASVPTSLAPSVPGSLAPSVPGSLALSIPGSLAPSIPGSLALSIPGSLAPSIPLLVRMRYGAGQSLYLATDEIWRWRYGRGGLYFQQFWVPLVRMLGRGRLDADSGHRARLAVSQPRVGTGQAVVVELTVTDPSLLAHKPPSVKVAISHAAKPDLSESSSEGPDRTSPSNPSGPSSSRTPPQDRLGKATAQLELHRVESRATSSASRQMYRGVWQPTQPGQWILRVVEPGLADLDLSRRLEVLASNDEMRNLAADHARLAALAKQTGGQVVGLNDLAKLASIVPNRSQTTAADVRESLTHSALPMIIILLLFTAEWLVRKMIWLV